MFAKDHLSGQRSASVILLHTWNFPPIIGRTIFGRSARLPMKQRGQNVFTVSAQRRHIIVMTEIFETQSPCNQKLHVSRTYPYSDAGHLQHLDTSNNPGYRRALMATAGDASSATHVLSWRRSS